MNLERFLFLGISRNFSASIGSFQGLPAEASEVILLSQRLALKYNTTPPDDCQHFLTSFFQFLCAGGLTLSVIAARCQIPPFVTCGDIFPRPGEICPLRGSFWHRFLIASKTLVTGITACALSVKAYGFDSSPKGRAKSTPGNFLVSPNALATGFKSWLPLRGSWRGSA